MPKEGLNQWLSSSGITIQVACVEQQPVIWKKVKRCTSSMHLMLCNGLAFTLKSAPQVCVLFRVHAAEADVYLTQTLFCFYSDDVPYDVWNCIKCHFCYRGIHKECVLDTSLSHICSQCADVPAKKKLPFQEEQSTGRFALSTELWTCWGGGGFTNYHFLCVLVKAWSSPQQLLLMRRMKPGQEWHHIKAGCCVRECLQNTSPIMKTRTTLNNCTCKLYVSSLSFASNLKLVNFFSFFFPVVSTLQVALTQTPQPHPHLTCKC